MRTKSGEAKRGLTLLETVLAIWLLGLIFSSIGLLMIADTRLRYDVKVASEFRNVVKEFFMGVVNRSFDTSFMDNGVRSWNPSSLNTIASLYNNQAALEGQCETYISDRIRYDASLSRLLDPDSVQCDISFSDDTRDEVTAYTITLTASVAFKRNNSSNPKRLSVRLSRRVVRLKEF